MIVVVAPFGEDVFLGLTIGLLKCILVKLRGLIEKLGCFRNWIYGDVRFNEEN